MNILLIKRHDENQHLILPDVASELRRFGVRAADVWDLAPRLRHRIWSLGQKTAVISFLPIKQFRPDWAVIWQQAASDKVKEYDVLQAAGISIPKQVALYESVVPDLSGFGEYVVVKPARGARGAAIRVMRRNKARWRPISIDSFSTSGVNETLIAQEYIHTGPWPISYRVATVFGEPIYALRITANTTRPPIDYSSDRPNVFAGKTIVASSKGCTMDANVDQDILEFAKKVHTAFPNVPLLGTDIVRSKETGKLYALEVNSGGWTFHLANERYEQVKKNFGIDLKLQFGGAKAVARGIYRRLFWQKGAEFKNSKIKASVNETTLEGVSV